VSVEDKLDRVIVLLEEIALAVRKPDPATCEHEFVVIPDFNSVNAPARGQCRKCGYSP
jgi:hypothetical protein